ncbi:MAG TPA: hypothetical protein VEC96_11710 [Anaerolineae bacterium]|nr:hypothetical protein [Anaerolineae bacterium]
MTKPLPERFAPLGDVEKDFVFSRRRGTANGHEFTRLRVGKDTLIIRQLCQPRMVTNRGGSRSACKRLLLACALTQNIRLYDQTFTNYWFKW